MWKDVWLGARKVSRSSKQGTAVSRKRLWRKRKTHFEVARGKSRGKDSRTKKDGKRRRQKLADRRCVAESSSGAGLASFLRNSARQLREKLVLASVGSGRCEGFEQGAAVRNTKGWLHPLISYDLVLDATTQLKTPTLYDATSRYRCEIKLSRAAGSLTRFLNGSVYFSSPSVSPVSPLALRNLFFFFLLSSLELPLLASSEINFAVLAENFASERCTHWLPS